MIRYMRDGMCVVAGCVNPRFQQSLIPHLRTMSIKLSDRLRRQAMAWFAGVCIISLCGGAALSGCGTIHGYGGVEHSGMISTITSRTTTTITIRTIKNTARSRKSATRLIKSTRRRWPRRIRSTTRNTIMMMIDLWVRVCFRNFADCRAGGAHYPPAALAG